MSKILNGEKVLCSIKSHKDIKTSTIIGSFFANLVTMGLAGMVTNNFNLILTSENLYIEAKGYATWGGLPEERYVDKINRKDIQSFDVKCDGADELITIITIKNKKLTFIRNNENNNNLALEMARLISEDIKN
ncbi:hypothetical protein [Clostridium weizhouense]|uniref:YokE-like PH domain-containing protein n=1 Tax=Clostridium weizhouense TaxID=2859781 RepID=A0ABS7APS6_9CLOT|nr:hypothetical protein [Clostridium weizhouense]MBW6410672.1 hypothetical protein [Clostridium weizhouense]